MGVVGVVSVARYLAPAVENSIYKSNQALDDFLERKTVRTIVSHTNNGTVSKACSFGQSSERPGGVHNDGFFRNHRSTPS